MIAPLCVVLLQKYILLPFQGANNCAALPRTLPWADRLLPFQGVVGRANHFAMLTGCSDFPNNHFAVKFSFFEDMLDVFTDVRFTRLI